MKKAIAIVIQILIFVGAWALVTPDTLVDNTYVFGLIGSYDLVRGNAHWVLLGAAVASVLNILIWWPKSPTHKTVGDNADTKSAETDEAKAKDPVVPKMD